MASFAVIGGGLAGISVAYSLKKAGHQCVVFEKSRGRGGRLSTRRLDGWQVDHGTQYFTARTSTFRAEVEHWQQLGWVSEWPVQPWKLDRETFTPSPDDQIRYLGVPTMNAMVHGMSIGMEFYADTRIDRLEKQGQQWRLWDGQGEHYGLYDAVILTAPLAQSLALLPAGAKAEATLKGASMTPTWAFALALTEPTDIEADALFSSDGIVNWACRDSSKPGRPNQFETWLVHFSPAWTANHLNASEDLLHQQVVHLLERLSGKDIKIHEYFKHRWLHARSSSHDRTIPQWDNDQKIGLAGDWTLGSRLEDAWLSAQKLCEEMLVDFA